MRPIGAGHSCLTPPNPIEENNVSNSGENIEGKVKEAAGDLTNNDGLRREGKTDQASAKVKDAIEHAVDKVEDVVDDVKDRIEGALHRK